MSVGLNKPELFYHEEGYYIARFQSKEDMNKIFHAGQYSVNNRPMILKPWTPDFELNAEFLSEIPLRVTFPKLPMTYWSCNSLNRIASAIGVPFYADECTTKQTRISCARMLIQANVTKPLPMEVMICDGKGTQFQQAVEYDWKPEFCEECQQIGHRCKPKQQAEPDQFEQPRRRRRASRDQQTNMQRPGQQSNAHNRFAPIWKPKKNNHRIDNEENETAQQIQNREDRDKKLAMPNRAL